MAYQIEYAPDKKYLYPVYKKRRPLFAVKWVPFVLLLAAALYMRLYGIPDFMIPGDAEITKEAATVFMEEIQNGTGVKQAATDFCKMMLDGAEIAY